MHAAHKKKRRRLVSSSGCEGPPALHVRVVAMVRPVSTRPRGARRGRPSRGAHLVLPFVVTELDVEGALLEPLQLEAELRPQLLEIDALAVLEHVAVHTQRALGDSARAPRRRLARPSLWPCPSA